MDKKMPWKDHGKGGAKAPPTTTAQSDMREGVKHLGEHMKDERREIDRSYCNPAKDSH